MPEDLSVTDSRSTEELDKLADEGPATNRERPMSAPKEEKPIGDAPAKPDDGFEFEHGGKKVKGTREQILKWAQMGYDRPQFMQKFNQEKTKFESDRTEWEKKWGVYRDIDEIATKNPDWWKFVEQQWQTRGQAPQTPAQTPAADPYAPKFQEFNSKLSQIEPVVTQMQSYLQTVQQEKEDQALDGEIKSIREKYKDLDWDSIDDNGKSRELMVLEHASANGIKSFKTAFLDLFHDDLTMRAASQAKLDVSKGIQRNSKLGVLGESPTPQKWSPKPNKDIKKMSYDELAREGLEEELARSRA